MFYCTFYSSPSFTQLTSIPAVLMRKLILLVNRLLKNPNFSLAD